MLELSWFVLLMLSWEWGQWLVGTLVCNGFEGFWSVLLWRFVPWSPHSQGSMSKTVGIRNVSACLELAAWQSEPALGLTGALTLNSETFRHGGASQKL